MSAHCSQVTKSNELAVKPANLEAARLDCADTSASINHDYGASSPDSWHSFMLAMASIMSASVIRTV